MPIPETAAPSKRRSFLRNWLPLLILGIGAAVLAALAMRPFPEWEDANRNVSMMFTGIVTSGLLLLWVVLFSGFRWWARLAILLGVAAVGASTLASVRDVKFSGDMLPTFQFKWQPKQEDIVAMDREHRVATSSLPPIRLDEGK